MNLVTGATGHIGNVLVRQLVGLGERVRALVLPGEDCAPLQGLPVEIVEGDVLDFSSLYQAMQGANRVYHLAGLISITPGSNRWVQVVNLIGTRNVLAACQMAKVQRLVYTSSIHAFTRLPHGYQIDETVPFDPENAISDYDRSKAQASVEVKRAARNGLDAVIVCPTGVIGPFDYRRSEMGQLILDCLQKKPQFYFEGAYDFVDVRDVAEGLIRAGQFGKLAEVYILSGEKISIRKLFDSIRQITGIKFPQIKVPITIVKFLARIAPLYYQMTRIRPRLTPYAIATLLSNSDISHHKATQELGYQPRPLVDTIRDTITWFCQNSAAFSLPLPQPAL